MPPRKLTPPPAPLQPWEIERAHGTLNGRPAHAPVPPEVLRISEAAAYLRIGEKLLRRLAREGRVPCQRMGDGFRFSRAALDSWLSGEATGCLRARVAGEGAAP